MVLAADYPFLDILGTMLVFFFWVMWFWTLIVILGDVFSRQDIGGWTKAGWTLFVFVLPLLGVLVYLIAQGSAMAQRRAKEYVAQQAMMDDHIRAVSGNGGAAGEIAHAKALLDSGAIDSSEFDQIKQKALA